jgi:hypothetical protein
MPEFEGLVSSMTGVDDPSWSGSVIRINIQDPKLHFIHVLTTTQKGLFETAFAQRKIVRLLANPLSQNETPLVVWNNVTNLNLYQLFRAGIQHDDLV